MRLRKIKDAGLKLREYSDYVVFDPALNFGRWHNVFANSNPIFLEIGMGKGKFIIQQALNYQNINYIGCEVEESIVLRAARKIPQERINNLKLIICNALDLDKIFSKDEIMKIFLNFSDPWPKNRHERRRLTAPEYLGIYQQILCENGEIEIKTDKRHFFEYSLLQFNSNQFEFIDVSLDLHNDKRENIVTTEYEEKFLAEGKKIYYLKVKK